MNERATRRVVVDTNVFVGAAFNSASASATVVREVREGRGSMPWTDGTCREIRRVLERIPPLSWADVESLFRPETQWPGSPDEGCLEWVADPEDRKFAALARDAGAVLVSSDRHLLVRRQEASFTVLTPREYAARIDRREES